MARRFHGALDAHKVPYRGLVAWAQSHAAELLVGALLLVGTAMRLSLLAGEPLHQDEALYGFWGRLIASGQDIALAGVPVDKPPMALYFVAGSQMLFGASEYAIRLPALAASILSIPLVFVLASRLYVDKTVAALASAVMALSPYPVLMGATAFVDPLLVAWWLLSCWCSLRARWACAGSALALAFASKQQALLLAPVVLGFGVLGYLSRKRQAKWYMGILRFSAGFFLGVIPVLVWGVVRKAQGASAGFWSQGIGSYGGLRLIRSPELTERFQGWLDLHGYVFAWPSLGLLALLGVVILLGLDIGRWRKSRGATADILLFCFASAYSAGHWLVAFPVWDRYLLPLVPVFGLLVARFVAISARFLPQWAKRFTHREVRARMHWVVYAAVLAALLAGGIGAVQGFFPIGSDHGAYDGLVKAIDFVQTLPVGTVLYDRWLSWHYDFYLFGAYLYRAGFPDPEWLARDAASFYQLQRRVLVMPSWESSARLQRALDPHGLQMSPLMTAFRRDGSTSFIVYEIGAGDEPLR